MLRRLWLRRARVRARSGFAAAATTRAGLRTGAIVRMRRLVLAGLIAGAAVAPAHADEGDGGRRATDPGPANPVHEETRREVAREVAPDFVYDVALVTTTRPRIDRLRVDKSARSLELISAGVVVRTYAISLGSAPTGAKRELGDGRTPEGLYRIDWRKRDSDYHRALHISYPNAEDRAQARARGVRPGGSIMIHGLPNGLGFIGSTHTLVDWTDGCIAVTNQEIEELWEWVPDGVPIEIMP